MITIVSLEMWGHGKVHLTTCQILLWDGVGCTRGNGCCARIGMPWFYRRLPQTVNEDFEVRICKDDPHANEDAAVEKLELYIRS